MKVLSAMMACLVHAFGLTFDGSQSFLRLRRGTSPSGRAIVFMLAVLRLECFYECTYETLECLSLLTFQLVCHLSEKPSDSLHFVL